MAKEKKAKGSAVDVVAAQYAQAFKKIRAAMTAVSADFMKLLTEEQSRQIKMLSDKPFWLAPGFFVQAREEAGINQESLATMVGVSRSVIANIESGIRVATVEMAERIYTALKPLGGISATHGLWGVVELDRETQRRSIELMEKWLANFSAQLEVDKRKLAQTDAEILQFDHATLDYLAKQKWGR